MTIIYLYFFVLLGKSREKDKIRENEVDLNNG